MFGIGDFARLGLVSVRMLRHYDAIGLLRPAHVDPFTGHRSYQAAQLARLGGVASRLRCSPSSAGAAGPTFQALAHGIEENGYRSLDLAREISVHCPAEPAEWVTEMRI
jgi:hypothetical protein